MNNDDNNAISDFRRKVINFLKMYGYYSGVLVKNGNDNKYVNNQLQLEDVIVDKKSFKELKQSVNKVIDVCYENGFNVIPDVMNKFYNEDCKYIRNTYGCFFDKRK